MRNPKSSFSGQSKDQRSRLINFGSNTAFTRSSEPARSCSRSFHGILADRFFFNFRLPPEALERLIPVHWLKPQIINGFSVVSFCILRLKGLALWPFPFQIGFSTTSYAFRCGVIDISSGSPKPSVYIFDRNTDLAIASRLSPLIMRNESKLVNAFIENIGEGKISVKASELSGDEVFSATVTMRANDKQGLASKVFGSLQECVQFIHLGSSSYAPAVHQGYLARVDVEKEDKKYVSVDADIDFNSLSEFWKGKGLVFDSAVRAIGKQIYKWTYLGEVSLGLKVADSRCNFEIK